MRKTTIIVEDDDDIVGPYGLPPEMYRLNSDPCENCPNRPRNGEIRICACALPYMYGPQRVTCCS